MTTPPATSKSTDSDRRAGLASLSREELRKCLGRGFRACRVKAGLSQIEAAARIGVSNVHLCNIERGHNFPTMSLMAKAAELYGLDPYDVARRRAQGVLPYGEDS